jgi:hypothetical protein
MPGMIEATIDYVRNNEGYYYGEGAADLIALIAERIEVQAPDKSAKSVAEAIHAALRETSAAIGQDPNIETFLREEKRADGIEYRVSWESGPYEWAIHAATVVYEASGRLAEPYYSFDLSLYDWE